MFTQESNVALPTTCLEHKIDCDLCGEGFVGGEQEED